MKFSDKLLARIAELKSVIFRQANTKVLSCLLCSTKCRDEHNNWLSVFLVMDKVAEVLNVLPIEVYEVVTFLYYVYAQQPVGKYMFEILPSPHAAAYAVPKI